MKRIVQISIWFVSGAVALAQGFVQPVLPSGTANTEGNSSSADLFRTTSSTFQQVYSASEFSFLTGGTGRIDAVSFRFDGPTAQNFVNVWPGISVFVATTSRDPDSLTPNYSGNANNDSIEVYGGSLAIVGNDMNPLRPFEVRIPFTTPFFYDPSRGNLSLFIGTSSGPTNLVLDGRFTVGDSVGRVFGNSTSAVGTPDTFGLITRFDIQTIPEPSTWALTAVGFLFFYAVLRNRRKR